MSDEVNSENPFGVNPTKRLVSKGAEDLLFSPYEISKHGRIELVDYMGGDSMVERVATMGLGRKVFPENPDSPDFLRHLEASGIYEPFKSVQLKFNIRGPIDAALALVYEPSSSVNEYSGRYSVMLDSAQIPSVNEIVDRLKRDTVIERSTLYSRALKIHNLLVETRGAVTDKYKELIGIDMARELARTGLGTDNDTQFFWKNDLLSLAQFVEKQRKLHQSPQGVREYIEVIAEIAEIVAPEAWAALTNRNQNRKISLTMPNDDLVVDSPLAGPGWEPSRTRRAIAPKLEEKLFVSQTILEHGEIQAVDYLGNDSSSAEAARTSYGRGTKTLNDDIQLTKTLVRDLHTSPIEMGEIAFESKTPVFVDPRQAARHRTLDNHGFMGYTPKGSQFYIPPRAEMKYQDRVNRQGRGKNMDEKEAIKSTRLLEESFEEELRTANQLRELGAPESIVRSQKGVGFFTKRWRTGDTHNIGHYLMLRMDAHAQKEIRDQANAVNELHAAHTPVANQALHTYIINGIRLNANDIKVLQNMALAGQISRETDLDNLDLYKGVGFIIPKDKDKPELGKTLSREGLAFKEKLQRILDK